MAVSCFTLVPSIVSTPTKPVRTKEAFQMSIICQLLSSVVQSSGLFAGLLQMNMAEMNENLHGQPMESWHHAWVSTPKQTKSWIFSVSPSLSSARQCSWGWKWWQEGFGNSDNSDEKGSGRSVSGTKLKCHYASLFLAETAAGICLVSGSFHTKFL